MADLAIKKAQPKDWAFWATRSVLTLGELRTLARFVQADFLPLDFAGIAGHIPGATQRRTQRFIIFDQRTGDTVTDGTGLTGGATTFNRDQDVETLSHFHQCQRLTHHHAGGFAAEVLVQRTTVDD